LKLLYVAITRPKTVLIIYDDDTEERKPIQDYWRKVDAVSFVDRKMMIDLSLLPQNVR
jgi:superfamily I DNA/RNA helicase